MAKLQNVTNAELADAVGRLSDLDDDLMDISDRISKLRCDDLTSAVETAKMLAFIAGHISELSGRVLSKVAIQERDAEYKELLARRDALGN
jgi:hypothetical protein